jgi:hypothetical protein
MAEFNTVTNDTTYDNKSTSNTINFNFTYDGYLPPKQMAKYIKEHTVNGVTAIGEHTLRELLKQGFPCIKIGTSQYINIATFNDDIRKFANNQFTS